MVKIKNATPEEWDEAAKAAGWGAGRPAIETKDLVNDPEHYTQHKWPVIDVLEEFFGEDPLLWQVGKYIMRYQYKQDPIQDLEKAVWYLNRKINKLKGN